MQMVNFHSPHYPREVRRDRNSVESFAEFPPSLLPRSVNGFTQEAKESHRLSQKLLQQPTQERHE
jgi:hypothetical protein